MQLGTLDISILIAYFIIIVFIGVYTTRRISGFDDYSVAGRTMPKSLIFATVAATLAGGGATVGRVAFVYETGIVIFVGVLGVVCSQILIGLFIAARVRELGNVYTVGDIMGFYYGRSGRLVSSIISFLYSVSIFGVQILAMGRILETITGLPFIPMTIIASAITVAYTWGGGMLAVIYTDAVQFVILTLGIATAVIIALRDIGGMEVVVGKINALGTEHLAFGGNWTIGVLIAFFLTFLLGEALAPFYIQRYASAKSARDSKSAVVLFGLFYGFFTVVVMGIGLIALAALPGMHKDLVFTAFILEYMPIGIIGLVFGGLIAAVMSTGDSILNTASVIFTRDIYSKFINKNVSDTKLLNLSKVTTLIVGAGGVGFALLIPSVFDLMIYTFELWAPSIVPPIVIALIWGKALERKVSPYAGIPAVIAGITVTLIWMNTNSPFGVPPLVAGILANLVVFAIVQLLTSEKTPTKSFIPEEINN